MPDFVLILSSLYCRLFDDSALVLGHGSEKDKNHSVKLVSWEVKLENFIFNHFYDSQNGIHHINLVKIMNMKYF